MPGTDQPARQAHKDELHRVFRRAWQYAGVEEQLRRPGDYLTADAGAVPVVVVRGQDGLLRARVNVCRHRGHLVMTGEGRCTALRCPQHAWTYELDGTLREGPTPGEPGWDPDGLDLLPAAVDICGPLVFVHADPRAAPLREHLGRLPGHIMRLDGLRLERRTERQVPANWKVAVEDHLRHSQGPRHWLWPNVVIGLGAGSLSVRAWLPDGPDRTVARVDHLAGPAVAAPTPFDIPSGEQLVAEFRRGLQAALRA